MLRVGKFNELESLRGIAAIVVLFHHFLLQFVPHLHGRMFPEDPIALVRTPLFALVNGSAAVAVFFVLSGFVLTFRALERRDMAHLFTGAVKRWPRLALLVTTVNVVAGVFLAAGLFTHLDREWLDPATYMGTGGVLLAAIREGLFSTFWQGRATFNAALWTMHYELVGSFLAYATAGVMIGARTFSRSMLAGAISLFLIWLCGGENWAYYATIVAGVLIARLYVERLKVAAQAAPLGSWLHLVLIAAAILAVILCGFDGYSAPAGFYVFMAPYAGPQTEEIVHSAGAIIILLIVLFHQPTRRVLAGRAARALGRLSFPLYLVHLPILHGIIFWLHAYLATLTGETVSVAISFFAFMALTLVAAYPLARLDEWWVQRLGKAVSIKLGAAAWPAAQDASARRQAGRQRVFP